MILVKAFAKFKNNIKHTTKLWPHTGILEYIKYNTYICDVHAWNCDYIFINTLLNITITQTIIHYKNENI